jgi:hypothetical protein
VGLFDFAQDINWTPLTETESNPRKTSRPITLTNLATAVRANLQLLAEWSHIVRQVAQLLMFAWVAALSL